MLPFGELKSTTKLTWPATGKRRGGIPKVQAGAEKLKQQQETPGLINGQEAGSSYEWNVARALWALGWQFSYQVPVMGGREIRGGQVLDFLVHTRPLYTALIVNGDYWHQDDEDLNNAMLIEALLARGIGVYRIPLVLWMAQASTYEAAFAYINSKIGKG